jgi:hypothetical protein
MRDVLSSASRKSTPPAANKAEFSNSSPNMGSDSSSGLTLPRYFLNRRLSYLLRYFLTCNNVASTKPKKKAKPSPALMPITPEVEVPPKPSSSAVPRIEEEVIQIKDGVEQTVDSSKDA